jgi:uncharacterized protein YndB with AHSA1/START domain
MKLDLNLEERFEQPIDEVWAAITDAGVLGRWLMENDFEPQVGRPFTLRHGGAAAGGAIACVVLELDPPRRMVWSWSKGDEPDQRPSRVTFELRPHGDGTLLKLKHTGSAGDAAGELATQRWPILISALRSLLRDRIS